MAGQFPNQQPNMPPPYPPPPGGGGLIGRLQRLYTNPRWEWQAIDGEPGGASATFAKLAVPLAAIGPAARLGHDQLFGIGAFGVSYKPGLLSSLLHAVGQYAGALAGVWIMVLVIEALAPSFNAYKNRDQTMKLVCWSGTAAWITQGFAFLPYVGYLLPILGLFSIYLFVIGLPILLKPQPDKSVGYIVVSLIGGGVAAAIAGALIAFVFNFATPASSVIGNGGTVTLGSISDGHGSSVNLDQLAAAGQQMAANAERAQQTGTTGTTTLADAAALQAMLPASVAGFTRGSVESSSGNAGGIGASTAKATYTMGDQSFELSISDVGALGGLAGLAGSLNVNSNKTTATGYERVTTTNGQMVEENWDNSDHRGKYSTMVASRFAVAAEGNAPSIDPLKAAVAAIDQGRLAGMAR